MNQPAWTVLASQVKVYAKPRTEDPNGNPPVTAIPVWQEIYPYVAGSGLLKITATGIWTYSTRFQFRCDANGDLVSPFSLTKCVSPNAPVGALIGKIGGSAADKDGTMFTIGSSCIRTLDQTTPPTASGPLYAAINDLWNGFGDNDGSLEVTVSFAPLPVT